MNTDQILNIRRWDRATDTIVRTEVQLDELAANPYCYNLADVGLFFINQIRKEMNMQPLPDDCVA